MLKRGFVLAALAAGVVAPGTGAHESGHTTLDHTIVPQNPAAAYSDLTTGGPWPRVLRDGAAGVGGTAQDGREARRSSLFYFGQLTDFQLSDEESPARVEFLDADGSPASSAHRPQEALVPFLVDQAIRALNGLGTSPHGTGASLDMTLVTGDQADNQQENEVKWVVGLLEGGTIDPNSGVEDDLPTCGANGEAARYTGVQDYDDYLEGDFAYYDPDSPQGKWAAFHAYPGLMDRAQASFTAAGSDAPTYVTNGNHDSLAQGNAWANAVYETIAVGCAKPMNFLPGQPSPSFISSSPQNSVDVPHDPARRYVDKAESKALHDTVGGQADAHGYAYVDPAEDTASNGAASYYAFSPKPGLRLISIDTVSEGGTIGDSSNGNIDDPQFQWLAGELADAQAANDLIVVMGHHPIRSLTSMTPDEAAAPCTGVANDPNPGCDLDPRVSLPIRGGSDLRALLLAHENVIAYVSGHTHEHKLLPFKRADGSGGFWELNTSSLVDWPVQGRVAEIVDNNDGTLSILSTVFDHNGPVTAEPAGPAIGLSEEQLAAIGRTLAYNDPGAGPGVAEGLPADRNVELIVPDPR